jgi:hypothetical protein
VENRVTKSRENNIELEVIAQIEADGVKVPAGKYAGIKRELGVPYMGKTVWQPPEYLLEIPEAPGSTFLSSQVDVTAQVSAGTVIVR